MNLKYLFAGLVAGFLSVLLFYAGAKIYEPFAVFYLFFGPGVVFAVLMLVANGRPAGKFRSLIYFLVINLTYFGAIWLYLYLDNRIDERIALMLPGIVGAIVVALLTQLITPTKYLPLLLVSAGILGALASVPIPIERAKWGPDMPNLWLLFPIWQTLIGGCIAFFVTNQSTNNEPN